MLILAASVAICILGSAAILLLAYRALSQPPQYKG